MSADSPLVLVTGDCVVDHHWYEGARRTPDSLGEPTRQARLIGGASLLLKIVRQLADASAGRAGQAASTPALPWHVAAAFDEERFSPDEINIHSYAIWHACAEKAGSKKQVWRLRSPLGYGRGPESGDSTAPARADAPPAEVLVLDDGGLRFRHQRSQAAWPRQLLDPAPPPNWVIYKMSAPLAAGDLWRLLKARHAERLIGVVSIRDLRREEVLVGQGSSWESTALDLAHELQRNPAVQSLLLCRHLIVVLESEGALCASRDAAGQIHFRLIYDPQFLEGEWGAGLPGTAVGYMSCFTAALIRECAEASDPAALQIERGVRAGLAAMRRLRACGHGPVADNTEPGFPLAEVTEEILNPQIRLQAATIPTAGAMSPAQRASWSIVTSAQVAADSTPRPLYGLAARVARHGLAQFGGVPFARFGKLFTVDRAEIESLRSIQRLMIGYLRSQREVRPLSLAVFGPPGSGKSFGVKQLAAAIYDREFGQKAPVIEFNLSQFADPGQLIGAFHAVRDKVLEGLTPLVFWDEFDSQEYRWLQYLLAPMQDGKFNEGQITHPIGKCVFVFAGGTSYNFAHFGPQPGTAGAGDFKLKKGPDFKSRLSGYLDVLGPNPRPRPDTDPALPAEQWLDDEADICFPLRRALLIRSLLGLGDHQRLQIDSGILSALLELKRYRHGARSLEKIEGLLTEDGGVKAIVRSAIPPRELIEMHADYAQLLEIANRDLLFRAYAPQIAPHIHADWRANKKRQKKSFKYDDEFENLPDWLQEENIAAAERISRILALVGLLIVPDEKSQDDPAEQVPLILRQQLEFLAEEEHDGWLDHKLRNNWQPGPRDDDQRFHDGLIPYRELPDDIKQYDRNSVEKYPLLVKRAGFRIVPAGKV